MSLIESYLRTVGELAGSSTPKESISHPPAEPGATDIKHESTTRGALSISARFIPQPIGIDVWLSVSGSADLEFERLPNQALQTSEAGAQLARVVADIISGSVFVVRDDDGHLLAVKSIGGDWSIDAASIKDSVEWDSVPGW